MSKGSKGEYIKGRIVKEVSCNFIEGIIILV